MGVSGVDEQNRAAASAPRQEKEYIFTGGYQHSMDNKGRLIVPNPFRESLGPVFCIGPSFNFKAIALYPTSVWEKTRQQYKSLGAANSNLKMYLENFDAMSYRDQECDAQGRVLLPARLRINLLGEEKDVDVLGSGEYIRILSRKASADQFDSFMAALPDILEALDRLGAARDGIRQARSEQGE